MDNLLPAVVALCWLEPRYNAQLQLLREQILILRARVDAEHIVPTPAERTELLRIGALQDHEVIDLVHVVRPATYHRWRRKQTSTSPRPAEKASLREVAVRRRLVPVEPTDVGEQGVEDHARGGAAMHQVSLVVRVLTKEMISVQKLRRNG